MIKKKIFRAGCDSGADSIVWMKEDDGTVILIDECSV